MKKNIKNNKTYVIIIVLLLTLTNTINLHAKSKSSSSTGSSYAGSIFKKGALLTDFSAGWGAFGQAGMLGRVSVEHGFSENIGLGGYIGYSAYGESISAGTVSISIDFSIILIGGIATYHFKLSGSPNLDLFIGADIGYNSASVEVDSIYSSAIQIEASGVSGGAFGGLRYGVSDKLALNAKLGYGVGVGIFEAGLTYKMK
ncbi:MAG: hypothetical protein OEZ22_10990 [Spirochaetia bacterium]|nr:hypothetical protein [Spirochaetia bacterium]